MIDDASVVLVVIGDAAFNGFRCTDSVSLCLYPGVQHKTENKTVHNNLLDEDCQRQI